MAKGLRLRRHFQSVLVLVLVSALLLRFVFADQQSPITKAQHMQLSVGDSIIVTSNRSSIQRVLLMGNLTAVKYTQHSHYPTNEFTLTTSNQGTYDLKVFFDLQSGYVVNLYVQSNQSTVTYITPKRLPAGGQPRPNPNSYNPVSNQSATTNSTSYYISAGPFELDMEAEFILRSSATFAPLSSESPSTGFIGWVGNFEQAFPLWTKLLYLALGIQFFAVGGLWIRRESSRRKSSGQILDAGNKVFLWFDVAYKFLLTSFLAITAIMGGELLLLFILRFMFLVSLDPFSLSDLFVVGFAAIILIMAYSIRFTLEKGFNLNPLEEE